MTTLADKGTRFREAIRQSASLRLAILGAVILTGIIVNYAGGFAARIIESRNIMGVVEAIKAHPKSVNLLETPVSDGYRLVDSKTIKAERRYATATIFMVEADLKCKNIEMAAVDGKNVIVNWQVDYRYVYSNAPGRNWLVTTVFTNMPGTDSYSVHLLYDDGCATVAGVYALPVNSVEDWDGLYYNDNFYMEDWKARSRDINGYKVMPTKLRFNGKEITRD